MSQAGSMLLNVLVDYQAVDGAQDADVIKASAVPRIRPLNVPLLEHADWS